MYSRCRSITGSRPQHYNTTDSNQREEVDKIKEDVGGLVTEGLQRDNNNICIIYRYKYSYSVSISFAACYHKKSRGVRDNLDQNTSSLE